MHDRLTTAAGIMTVCSLIQHYDFYRIDDNDRSFKLDKTFTRPLPKLPGFDNVMHHISALHEFFVVVC